MVSSVDPKPEPVLSVIVATVDAEASIEACLSALQVACARIAAEILVVDASRDRTLELVARGFPAVGTIRFPPGTVVPVLWSRGLEASRGTVVAFAIGQCLVSPTWAESLLQALRPGVGGAGGALTPAPTTGPADWAVFFLRYSAFIEERWRSGPVDGEIAGDNAAYRRSDLLALGLSYAQGFWEVEAHRVMRQRALSLVAVRGATAVVARVASRRQFIRHRFIHGCQFGASRVRAREVTRARVSIAAPLVPAALAWRAARRVLPYGRHRWRFLASLPWFMVFAGAWALGEVVGAWRGPTPGAGAGPT